MHDRHTGAVLRLAVRFAGVEFLAVVVACARRACDAVVVGIPIFVTSDAARA